MAANISTEEKLIASISANTNNPQLLPEEILLEIFTKLPTKSVGKCRCLSKHWSNLLSTTHFIKKHLSIRQKDSSQLKQENLFLVDKKRSFLVINSPTVKQQESIKNLSYDLGLCDFFYGSCNGLILLDNENEKLLLINPITLKHVKLPDLDKTDYDLLSKDWVRALVVFGFGYECVSDEYKVIAVTHYMNLFKPEKETVVQVYSVKKGGSWRVVKDGGGYGDMFPSRKCGVLVNGALHWSTGVDLPSHVSLIAAFDLASESFRRIQFPAEFNKQILFNEVMALGECLCMVDSINGGFADLWMMKEYGIVESWTKVRICASGLREEIKLLCFAGKEKVLGVSSREKWALCDVTNETCKEVAVCGNVNAPYCDGGPFVDSLVDPEKLVEEVVG